MSKCPAPGCTCNLSSDDPNHADWVALGLVVCSQGCHEAMYQLELPFTDEEKGQRDGAKEQGQPQQEEEGQASPSTTVQLQLDLVPQDGQRPRARRQLKKAS